MEAISKQQCYPQEDDILKNIYEVQGITNWSEIAKIMNQKYKIDGRTGKQCRQRYHNHLKDGISKEKWTKEEEQLLVDLHSKFGNRWALISTFIKGRSQNCIKNMLYSKLRKAVRQLNKFSFHFYRKELKEIKVSFITRLIQFTQKFYKSNDTETNQQYQIALNIKNFMLMFDCDEVEQISEQQKRKIREVIESISLFKKVNQRFRFKTIASKVVKNSEKPIPNKGKLLDFQEIEEESQEEHSVSKYQEKINEEQERVKVNQRQMPTKIARNNKIQRQDSPELLKRAGNNRNSYSSYVNKVIFKNKLIQDRFIQAETPEAKRDQQVEIKKIKSKFGGRRLDSLDSNRSYLLVDTQIQKPIFLQSIITLTPTPYHPPHNFNDWGNMVNIWKNNNENNQQ